jgi:hypothetical protein
MKFELYPDQIAKINEWMKKLSAKYPDKVNAYTGAIGGRFSYTFFPCSIGEIVTVTDGLTGEKLDISDV